MICSGLFLIDGSIASTYFQFSLPARWHLQDLVEAVSCSLLPEICVSLMSLPGSASTRFYREGVDKGQGEGEYGKAFCVFGFAFLLATTAASL